MGHPSSERAGRSREKYGLILFAAALFLGFALQGCSFMTVNTMKNEQLDPKTKPPATRASETISVNELSDGIFIGIALSGGGSRAANFSAAVLFELERLGILNRATAISSVSGSSLPAAYYGLYGIRRDENRWNPDDVRKQLRKDFEMRWIGRWFLPQNILYYWSSNFNRSDIMKEVLDSNLFHKHTFGDMGGGRPRILINATTLLKGQRFVYSDEQFNQDIGSRIDTFPIANAVMASSAFPGAFHDMTLKDYKAQGTSDQKRYQHVLDGGPSDNLGTTTLLDMVAALYKGKERKDQPKGCFLFVVDAYPYPTRPEHTTREDTRSAIDFIFDTNVAASSDALLTARRTDLMAELNIDVRTTDLEPFQVNAGDDSIWPDPYDDLRVECAVWHVSLQRLLAGAFADTAAEGENDPKSREALRREIIRVANVVNSIPTRYKLKGKDPDTKKQLSSKQLQDDLFGAAHYLMYLDKDRNRTPILKQVCDWFAQRGVRDLKCE